MAGMWEWLARRTGMPPETVVELPRAELCGGRSVLLENVGGILRYQEEEICVAAGDRVLRIHGCNLELKKLTAESMYIIGTVEGLEWI